MQSLIRPKFDKPKPFVLLSLLCRNENPSGCDN